MRPRFRYFARSASAGTEFVLQARILRLWWTIARSDRRLAGHYGSILGGLLNALLDEITLPGRCKHAGGKGACPPLYRIAIVSRGSETDRRCVQEDLERTLKHWTPPEFGRVS